MKTIIKQVCCVCHIQYGTKDGKGKSGISHGYCPECSKIEMEKTIELLEQENI